jgi:hypothetical protein
MQIKSSMKRLAVGLTVAGIAGTAAVETAFSRDIEWSGFAEEVVHHRKDIGISKARSGFQLEGLKFVGDVGPFSNVSVNGIMRISYDAVYDLNDDEYGDNAGGAAFLNSYGLANIGAPTRVPVNGNGLGPADGLSVGNFAVMNILGPRVEEITGAPTGTFSGAGGMLSGNTFVDSYANNPNVGMITLGDHLRDHADGVAFGVPVRPCDTDGRGCIDDYMDADKNELASPEIFSDRADWLRELYVDATLLGSGDNEINFRLGKQQVIWGRTDLFRVLDVINPVDYSRNNIYDELEDIRIPMWMLKTDFRFGATGPFDDFNMQVVWNFDKFRPNNLGQCGTPNVILDAGCFFRGMKNLWDNGGTVANFAPFDPADPSLGLLATNFGPQTIGIRNVELPSWSLSNTQLGFKVEGVKGDFGWSVNALTYRSQLPSLRAGNVEVVNPFVGGEAQTHDYLIAFDVAFPRVNLLGASVDYYSQAIDTVFRVEVAGTQGEEFANTLRPELYSESDVVRFVIGADKNVFIRPLNKDRAFLISGQIFGQHLLDHEVAQATLGEVGMPDWEKNYIATLLIKGWWMNDRLSPQLIMAHDFRAGATVVSPSVDWLISDNWQMVLTANYKTGGSDHKFDDCRLCNPFGPFTTSIPGLPEHGADGLTAGSAGLTGYEPLGRFRSGPLGMAEKEDEIQIAIRYRF